MASSLALALKAQRGQTLVEYLLLLFLVIGATFLLLRSPFFKQFTAQGEWVEQLMASIQFSYRHGLPGKVIETYPANYNEANHRSFVSEQNETRFFGPADEYP